MTDHHASIDAHFERSNRQDVMYSLPTYSSNTQNCRVMTIRDVEMAGLALPGTLGSVLHRFSSDSRQSRTGLWAWPQRTAPPSAVTTRFFPSGFSNAAAGTSCHCNRAMGEGCSWPIASSVLLLRL